MEEHRTFLNALCSHRSVKRGCCHVMAFHIQGQKGKNDAVYGQAAERGGGACILRYLEVDGTLRELATRSIPALPALFLPFPSPD